MRLMQNGWEDWDWVVGTFPAPAAYYRIYIVPSVLRAKRLACQLIYSPVKVIAVLHSRNYFSECASRFERSVRFRNLVKFIDSTDERLDSIALDELNQVFPDSGIQALLDEQPANVEAHHPVRVHEHLPKVGLRQFPGCQQP